MSGITFEGTRHLSAARPSSFTLAMNIHSYAIAVSLAIFIQGCANTNTSWRESVASSDQQIVILDRAETRWAMASASLPGSGYPESQYLSASIRATSA